MTAFVIKSGICMVLFFGLYWLFLRKEKLFIFNRYYLIFSIIFSLAVPFITFPVSIAGEAPAFTALWPGSLQEETLPQTPEYQVSQKEVLTALPGPDQISRNDAVESHAADNKKIVPFIYLTGLLLMMIRFCRNMLKVNLMTRRSEKVEKEWYQIALVDERISPFSFLRTVFLNKQDYFEKRVGANVMNHELVHIRQAHSLDIIFFEIFHLAFWFNPVLYLYKRAARINHEYLADEAVTNSSPDPGKYTDELVSFISHRLTVPYTSGFSPSMIKLRLLMLNTKTSRQGKINRVLLTLMMSVFLMAGLSMKPEYREPDNRQRRAAAANKDIIIQDVFFRDIDFNPTKALVVLNGKMLTPEDSIAVDIRDIKTINVLNDRKAKRQFGKNAKNGVVEISTYESDRSSEPDTLYFKPIYTINNVNPEKRLSILVSNIYSVSMWTYPVFRNQAPEKRWRLLDIMTRDYYKISGNVTRSDGEPIGKVLVSASNKPAETLTGEDGRFTLSDINPDSRIELSSEGYNPFIFKVTANAFKSELKLCLRRINEPDPDTIITGAGTEIKDFSGLWRLNKELTRITFAGGYGRIYEIHQYNSDSIMIRMKSSDTDFDSGQIYVFNTATASAASNGNYKNVKSCIIDPGGQAFSIINRSRSIFATYGDYQLTETYTLSDDGKQMFIRESYSDSRSLNSRREFPSMVFDRVISN